MGSREICMLPCGGALHGRRLGCGVLWLYRLCPLFSWESSRRTPLSKQCSLHPSQLQTLQTYKRCGRLLIWIRMRSIRASTCWRKQWGALAFIGNIIVSFVLNSPLDFMNPANLHCNPSLETRSSCYNKDIISPVCHNTIRPGDTHRCGSCACGDSELASAVHENDQEAQTPRKVNLELHSNCIYMDKYVCVCAFGRWMPRPGCL